MAATVSPVLNTKRMERAREPTPVSSWSQEEIESHTKATLREDVTNRRKSRGQAGRTRKRCTNGRRRPKRNDLAEPTTSKLVNGVICLMNSKIYNFLGSTATEGNALSPNKIAFDTCSRYTPVATKTATACESRPGGRTA